MVIDTTSGINSTDSTSIMKRVGVVTFKKLIYYLLLDTLLQCNQLQLHITLYKVTTNILLHILLLGANHMLAMYYVHKT